MSQSLFHKIPVTNILPSFMLTHKPNDIFSPQIDGLLSTVERIPKEAKDGALVTIESTIPKGISRKVVEILNHRLHVAHAPSQMVCFTTGRTWCEPLIIVATHFEFL